VIFTGCSRKTSILLHSHTTRLDKIMSKFVLCKDRPVLPISHTTGNLFQAVLTGLKTCGNDDGGYNDDDIPVIPALDLGEAADHFLAVAVLLSAFLSLALLSRVVAAAAGQRGNQVFVAVSIPNDDDGV
jgi:hypothetical protein